MQVRDFVRDTPFCCVLGTKAVYLTAIIIAVLLWNDFDKRMFYNLEVRWPRVGGPVFASHFATWDAAHYLYLSELGYVPGSPSCAFYPLWPLLVRWLATIVRGSHVWTAIILANIFSGAAWLLFHSLVAHRFGRATAKTAFVLLLAFPGSLFFQFDYTESLFLFLILVLWGSLAAQQYVWAWIASSLLPLTRAVGVFVALPIAWHALRPAIPWFIARYRMRDSTCFKQNNETKLSGFPIAEVGGRAWLISAPIVGWGAYLTLMWLWTGNPFEGFDAQKHWGVHSISNLVDLPKFISGLLKPTAWHDFSGSILDRCAFLVVVSTVPVLWRVDKELCIWMYVLGILPAMSGTFTSYTRFASCTFPFFIGLALVLERVKTRWLFRASVLTFATIQVTLVWRFVNFRWAG